MAYPRSPLCGAARPHNGSLRTAGGQTRQADLLGRPGTPLAAAVAFQRNCGEARPRTPPPAPRGHSGGRQRAAVGSQAAPQGKGFGLARGAIIERQAHKQKTAVAAVANVQRRRERRHVWRRLVLLLFRSSGSCRSACLTAQPARPPASCNRGKPAPPTPAAASASTRPAASLVEQGGRHGQLPMQAGRQETSRSPISPPSPCEGLGEEGKGPAFPPCLEAGTSGGGASTKLVWCVWPVAGPLPLPTYTHPPAACRYSADAPQEERGAAWAPPAAGSNPRQHRSAMPAPPTPLAWRVAAPLLRTALLAAAAAARCPSHSAPAASPAGPRARPSRPRPGASAGAAARRSAPT